MASRPWRGKDHWPRGPALGGGASHSLEERLKQRTHLPALQPQTPSPQFTHFLFKAPPVPLEHTVSPRTFFIVMKNLRCL